MDYGGTGTPVLSNNRTDDPLFTNAAAFDFTIQFGSPAKDSGTTVTAVTDDYASNPRPYNGVYDVGAYEFTPSPPLAAAVTIRLSNTAAGLTTSIRLNAAAAVSVTTTAALTTGSALSGAATITLTGTAVLPATASGASTLVAGTYQVRIAGRAPGQGSTSSTKAYVEGTPSAPVPVTITAGQSLSISFAEVQYAEQHRIYVTAPDGTISYTTVVAGAAQPVLIASTGTAITSINTGTVWAVKNRFEPKVGRNTIFRYNIIENHWIVTGVATGFPIWVKTVNQPPQHKIPYAQQTNVWIEWNLIMNTAGYVSIVGSEHEADLGTPNNTNPLCNPPNQEAALPRVTTGVFFRNNLCFGSNEVNSRNTAMACINLAAGGAGIDISHNTMPHDIAGKAHPIAFISANLKRDAYFYPGLSIQNNLWRHDSYGWKGGGAPSSAVGKDALLAHSNGSYVFTANVLAGYTVSADYPAGNLFPTETSFQAEFTDFANNDLSLKPGSTFRNAGTDGLDLGADVAVVLLNTANVRSGAPSNGATDPGTVPLVVPDQILPNGTAGVAYNCVLTGTGGVGTFTWTKVTGAFPTGLTLAANGTVSGTTSSVGTFMSSASRRRTRWAPQTMRTSP
jgi:hypothetical protein